MRVRIAEATSFQSFDGRHSVFAEASQRLFELNDTAMAVLAAMDDPVTLPALFDEIIPVLPGGAEALERLLVEWSACGLIELLHSDQIDDPIGAPAALLGSPAGKARLTCLVEECRWLSAYGHLPKGNGQGFEACGMETGSLGLVRIDGGASRIVPSDLLPATFRFHLVEALLERNPSVALHCAVLVRGGSATVLMGPPGTGKSTMALFAGKAGFTIGCDDIAFLDAESRGVTPLALPLTLKTGSMALAEAAGFAIDRTAVVPRNDGVEVMYLPLPNAPVEGPIPVRAIIKLERGSEEAPALSPWSKTECLELLCSEALSPTGKASIDTFRSMLAMVERAETLVLSYGEAERAVALLESHVAG